MFSNDSESCNGVNLLKAAIISLIQCKMLLMNCVLFCVMKEHRDDFKGIVVLQNCMGLVIGEPGSSSVPCDDEGIEVNTKAEEAIDIKEENIGEAVTLPLMVTEHEVRLCVWTCACVCDDSS